MTKNSFASAMLVALSIATASAAAETSIYSFVMDDINGKPVSLETFRGKVLLSRVNKEP